MTNTEHCNPTPWKDGYYRTRTNTSRLFKVTGETFIMHRVSGKPTNMDSPMYNGTLKFGDFGDAHPDVAKVSGKPRYNVEMNAWGGMWKPHLIVSDDGKSLAHFGMTNSVDFFEWMSDEEYTALIDSGDPVDAYPHPYKVQPENQGKLLWLSGAPGLGKSTCGLLLARNEGYVYYEADAFMGHLNPYVPVDVDEPSLATLTQNALKGVPQDRIDVVTEAMDHMIALMKGKEYDFDKAASFYTAMSKDIAREQKRIGGDFVIAQAVPTRAFRDHIRAQLGPNLIFVVLHMSKEDQTARIKRRHGDTDGFTDIFSEIYSTFEPAGEDEPNAIHVLVTNDMTRDDVVEKILRLVKDYSK